MSELLPEAERLINDAELERLRVIFDKNRKIETDEDLLELAELTEDESDENDLAIDNNFDFGVGN